MEITYEKHEEGETKQKIRNGNSTQVTVLVADTICYSRVGVVWLDLGDDFFDLIEVDSLEDGNAVGAMEDGNTVGALADFNTAGALESKTVGALEDFNTVGFFVLVDLSPPLVDCFFAPPLDGSFGWRLPSGEKQHERDKKDEG